MQMGVIPNSADSFNWCSADSFVDSADCSSFLDKAALTAKIEAECTGRKSCSITNLSSYMKVPQAVVSLA